MTEGLLDNAKVLEGGDPDAPSAEGVIENTWSWDDGVPGSGDRPEWLKEKYTNVKDQAKAYIEAERYVGKSKAPESYDLSGYSDFFDIEDKNFTELQMKAREHGLSQDAVRDIIDPITKYQESLIPNVDAEIKKLGDNAQAKIDVVNTWASNTLSEEALGTLRLIGNKAEVIKLFDEVRQKFNINQSQPPGSMHNLSEQNLETVESITAEYVDNPANRARYREDAVYRAEINRRLHAVQGDE